MAMMGRMVHEFFGDLLSVEDCPCGGCALITIETSVAWRSFFATGAVGAEARAMRGSVVVVSFNDEAQRATGIRRLREEDAREMKR